MVFVKVKSNILSSYLVKIYGNKKYNFFINHSFVSIMLCVHQYIYIISEIYDNCNYMCTVLVLQM